MLHSSLWRWIALGLLSALTATAGPAAGDYADGEDLAVRQAAIEALGDINGSVVVVDADSGRVLTMVNQKLALADGAIPCSTIKLVAGLAALSEGLIVPQQKVYFPGDWFMTITEGLAISNNVLFDHLGRKLGFERFARYARLFGLGEKAGWGIPGEQLGRFPEAEHSYGVGRMTSFGDGIAVTPLQLAAFTAALANGGKLFYLQHPSSQDDVRRFEPRLKRSLPIADWLTEVEQGMAEAVKRGTGRNAKLAGERIHGKTGTCSYVQDRRKTRMGWFTSFAKNLGGRNLSTVVMLHGGFVHGPLAAEVAGRLYRGLAASQHSQAEPAAVNLCHCD
jgi:penicillin-binding protein 2